MVEITLAFTDEQAAALAPAVAHEVERMARNPDVLAKSGLTEEQVIALPPKRKAKLYLYSLLMFARQRYDREMAARSAGDAAALAALDSSPVEVEP